MKPRKTGEIKKFENKKLWSFIIKSAIFNPRKPRQKTKPK